MRKYLGMALLAVCLFTLGAVVTEAQTTKAPAAGLTGKHWMAGDREGKLSFLYGASNVVALEQIGAEKTGKPASVFVQGWTNAFGNMTYPELMQKIDAWYEANPDKLDRNVFDVIWYELIVPATAKK